MQTETQAGHTPVLQVDQLEIWRGEHRLVHDFSFSARPGDIIHLKGPNGSGKTSLLRCLAGLSLPDAGSIHWFSKEYRGRVGPEARARCRFVGHLDGLKGGLDVRENLLVLQALCGAGGDVDEAIRDAGLASRASVLAQRLSAGQRRRAALAQLRLGLADAWLLDEPFTALDVEAVALIGSWIAKHVAGGGVVVLTTHQPLPEPLSARVITLGAMA